MSTNEQIFDHLKSKIRMYMITSGFKFLSLAEIRNNSEELTNFSKIVFDSVLKKELETNDEVSLTDINDDWYNDLASFYDCESANWFNQIGNIYSTRSVLDSFLDAQAEVIISDLEREVLQLHKTPAALVNEMLDQLPKTIWQDLTKTWFDPVCGTGEFIVQIYRRLLAANPGKEQHVIENMLYFNDINSNMTAVTCFRLDPANKYRKNYYNYDMLEEVVISKTVMYNKKCTRALINKKTGEIKYNIVHGNRFLHEVNMNFDVVVGNPPFQKENLTKGKNNHKIIIYGQNFL